MAHAPQTSAVARATLGELLAARRPQGSLVLATCHRVELYGTQRGVSETRAGDLPEGVQLLSGADAARQLIRVALGRESAVIGEDQVLHQLREAVRSARADGGLDPQLDRLADLALRAGRRARSWMPAQRGNIAESAVARVLDDGHPPLDRPVLVVGSGRIARLAAAALRSRGASLLVTSRTAAHAREMAERFGAQQVAFDPGPALGASVAGVVVGLGGGWPITPETTGALSESATWLIDLSAPPAVPDELRARLGPRLTTIDDLAHPSDGRGRAVDAAGARLAERLDRLVEQTLDEYTAWLAAEAQRSTAAALSRRAAAAQTAELEQLWQRLPTLDDAQREEVARTVRGLTQRLLRDPLERLGTDHDGRRAQAARDLFRL